MSRKTQQLVFIWHFSSVRLFWLRWVQEWESCNFLAWKTASWAQKTGLGGSLTTLWDIWCSDSVLTYFRVDLDSTILIVPYWRPQLVVAENTSGSLEEHDTLPPGVALCHDRADLQHFWLPRHRIWLCVATIVLNQHNKHYTGHEFGLSLVLCMRAQTLHQLLHPRKWQHRISCKVPAVPAD